MDNSRDEKNERNLIFHGLGSSGEDEDIKFINVTLDFSASHYREAEGTIGELILPVSEEVNQ